MWKSLFIYGCDIWEEDFEVWEEENGYSCSIEGLIYYDSLDKAIGYYEEMRSAFLQWLTRNELYLDEEIFVEDLKEDEYTYRTYDIEINKNDIGIAVFTNCPVYSTIKEVYKWLVGVINQLEDVNNKGGI